jgi:DNA-binding NarL/FixJ family response regulator
MLPGEWHADGVVVAGDVAVYRDLIAERLGGRGVTIDSVGDAELVVLCPNGQGLSAVASLVSVPERKVVVLGVAEDETLSYFEAGALCALPLDASADEVCDAVHRAGHGQTTLSGGQTTLVFHRIRETRSSAPHEAVASLTRGSARWRGSWRKTFRTRRSRAVSSSASRRSRST